MKLFSSHCCAKAEQDCVVYFKNRGARTGFLKSSEGKYNFGPANEDAACGVMLPVCPPDGINVSQMRAAQPQDFKSKSLPQKCSRDGSDLCF